MSIIGSFRSGMIGGRRDLSHASVAAQTKQLATYFDLNEYLKHRVHQKAIERWINSGQPEMKDRPQTQQSGPAERTTKEARTQSH